MDFVVLAERIATDAHRGQAEMSGAHYIEHPRRVASRLDTNEQRAATWLHYVLEDTGVTPSDLLAEGIPLSVVAAVQPLIADNSDEERLAQLDSPTQQRLRAKYATAVAALT